jgi:hypothetical protein
MGYYLPGLRPCPASAAADGKRLWVEILEPSAALGDITISAVYPSSSDTVDATGIWVNHGEADTKHDRTDVPWADAQGFFFDFTPTFGLVPRNENNTEIRNSIGLQFGLVPSGIWDQPPVQFDVTRQIESRRWDQVIAGGQWQLQLGPNKINDFPYIAELPNDDQGQGDEKGPTAQGHMYSKDAPGFALDDSEEGRAGVWNFNEFVRVAINDGELKGNDVKGSQASNMVTWHVLHNLNKQGTKLQRTTGDVDESADNDVAPGHVPLSRPGT